ncbi:MAG: DUF2971 domain-containing protein [Deltaproteobacteria bacterium]|nr:DUF2971 domain-containing protein [Deltaproteobacteria bacterium]
MNLYKYYSLATKAQMGYMARAIVNREIHCGDPATFNDPFDCNIAIHLKVYLKNLGVACFSGENADHVLMFSHYGDRHRGIALVFDVVDDGPIGDLTFLGLGQYVNYVEHDRLPDLTKCSDSSRAREVVLTKWKKWEYENEYRVFADLEECDPSRIRHYELGELVGVIFGLRTPDEDKQNIEDWIRRGQHRNVWQKQAQLSSDSFTLAFV